MLMEDSVRLQTIVWVLAHKDLGLAELHVRLWKRHGNRLMLHATDLLRLADSVLLRI